jgi:translation initiation factor 2B subunit (eIF-2B alpha/beta/delta family)
VNPVFPKYDFLPPEYITLHITQDGEHTTSYIYRLFNEVYSKEELNAEY